jgi:hypothetical protein
MINRRGQIMEPQAAELVSFSRWIGHTPEIKPEAKMPPFAILG